MQKSFLILLSLVFFWVNTTYGDFIYASGDVSGTWSADTVIVVDSVRVPPGATLIIEPGVEVLFWSCCQFIVDNGATLLAVGTVNDSILFDEYWENNSWKGIRFLNASDSSRLEYCHLTNGHAFGNEQSGGAIYINNSDLTILNCLINNCSADGHGGAIFVNNSNPLLTENTIISNDADSHGGGICCSGGSPTISNNTINDNFAGEYGGGIQLWDSNANIIGNTINGNHANDNGGGIRYCNASNPIISENTINGNSANDNGGGIACINITSQNIISDNIINGNWTGTSDYGGGIYCNNSNPNITNNTINGNSAGYGGGGIFCVYSNPIISYNIINSNSLSSGWGEGGGIGLEHSNPEIIGNTISGNSVEYGGGGIHCHLSSNPIINGNTITDNNVDDHEGGGICCYGSSHPDIEGNTISNNHAYIGGGIYSDYILTIINNIIVGNSASYGGGVRINNATPDTFELNEISNNTASINGGGVYLYGIAPTMNKNTIVYNNAGGSGGGIYCDNSSPQVVNTILWGNSPEQISQTGGSNLQATYSDIQQIWPGLGNIFAEPLFADPVNYNYQITWANFPDPDSTKCLCIDSGNPDTLYYDPDETRADMGCYFFDQGPYPPPNPDIALSADVLNFEEIIIGSQAEMPLTIYNIGDTTLVIYNVSTSNPDFTTDFNLADSLITAGDSLELSVNFAPVDIAAYNDLLTIENNDEVIAVILEGIGISPVTITMTPMTPPIIIPENGGSFDFNIALENLTNDPQTIDIWTMIILPEAGCVEVMNLDGFTIPAGAAPNRDRTQDVPEFAPAGTYTYYGYVGEYPWVVDNYDSFTFVKEGTDGSGYLGSPLDWYCGGESFDAELNNTISLPDVYALSSPYPNPFNPFTTLKYSLPEAGNVLLTIFDVQGREAAKLVDSYKPAGSHSITWNAENFTSGIYFARLTAGDFTQTQKLLLIK